LAVEHGFGGTESREKAEWLVFAIDQWFQENSNYVIRFVNTTMCYKVNCFISEVYQPKDY
jgi:hypothetical protein